MQHAMRRSDRELCRDEAERMLREASYGVLCTSGHDGVPYGVPISFVYDGQCIGFHSATEGHKIQNLRENPQACFTVVGATETLPSAFSTRYESAIAFGHLRPATGERKRDILHAFLDKYSPNAREKGERYIQHAADDTLVFELEVLRLSAKARR